MLQIGVMVRTITVTAFKQNYGNNSADEKHNTECANKNEEPWFVDTQVGISWEFYIFNMVGINSPKGSLAHESSKAWLRVIVAR